MRRTCFICGNPIPERYRVCGHCKDEWHLAGPVKTWPQWAQELKRAVAREVAHERQAEDAERELFEDAIPMCPVGMVAFGSDGEMVPDPSREVGGNYLLRYAPYTDETANRAYRKANRIAERG